MTQWFGADRCTRVCSLHLKVGMCDTPVERERERERTQSNARSSWGGGGLAALAGLAWLVDLAGWLLCCSSSMLRNLCVLQFCTREIVASLGNFVKKVAGERLERWTLLDECDTRRRRRACVQIVSSACTHLQPVSASLTTHNITSLSARRSFQFQAKTSRTRSLEYTSKQHLESNFELVVVPPTTSENVPHSEPVTRGLAYRTYSPLKHGNCANARKSRK
jgi:hypothetical protein